MLHVVLPDAVEAALEQAGRGLVGAGSLNGIARGVAVEHGIAGGVVGAQVVPGVPLTLFAVEVVPQGYVILGELVVVALSGDGAQSGVAVGLSTLEEVGNQNVIFQVGLVRGGAGLNQEVGHVAVELHKSDGVPLVDELGNGPGLGLGLEGRIPVVVNAVVVPAGAVGAPVGVLGQGDDHDEVVQQVVHLVRDILADGVNLIRALLAVVVGLGAVGLDIQVRRAAAVNLKLVQLVGPILGHVGAVLQSGESAVGQSILADQLPQQVELGVHVGILVRVLVVNHEGDAVILQGAALDLVNDALGIGGDSLVDFAESVHGFLAVGHHGGIHGEAALGLAVLKDFHIPAGAGLSGLLQGLQLIEDLVVPVIAAVHLNLQLAGADHLVTGGGGEQVGAVEAVEHVADARAAVIGEAHLAEEGIGGELQGDHGVGAAGLHGDGLSRGGLLGAGAVEIVEPGAILDALAILLVGAVPDLPVLQLVAGVNVGIDLGVLHEHVLGAGQGPDEA